MSFDFANPLWLWLFVPLAAHVLWMSRKLAMLSRGRRIAATVTRLVVLALLVAGVAGVRLTRSADELTVFFLMDASDSVPQQQREYAKAYIEKALTDQDKRRDKAGVIVFGGDAALEIGPTAQPEVEQLQSVVNSARTNISDALQLAMACFVGESQRRIVLLSDGNQNTGNAEDAARSAAASKIAIDVVPLAYENRNDVILEKAIVENRVSLEEPFDIKVIASARQATRGTLTVHQDGRLVGQFPVELAADRKNVFEIPTQVRDSGFHTFEVQLDAEGDALPENNRGYAFTYGEGEPRLLLVDGDSQPSQALPAVLVSEKIRVEVVPPDELPVSLRTLQNYDGVVFNNVSAGEISSDQMKMIERAVHDLGIGFMMLGGENSFGAGGYNDTPIEEILPVEMELKNEKILPQGALVPVIHTVEIPEGQFWAEQVAIAALDVLSPRDLMGLLYYSWQGGESWLFPLQEVGSKSHLRSMIKGMQPGDMPSFDKTLQMAYVALNASGASVKHIIIISDGDPQTPNPALATQIKSAKISISTVCINPHSSRDEDVMKELARLGGGNYYLVNSFNKLPQIFIKEATTVRKSLLIEELFVPAQKQHSPILEGIAGELPQLRGYVATGKKGLADTPLETHKGDPLLAHWRHGVGKTVAFTSDAKERWANAWLQWDRYAKYWSQAARWSLRSPFNPNYQLEMSIDGSKGRIVIDAVDEAGEFRNFLNVGGRVISPSNEAQDVTFRQTAAGRYEAEFEVTEAGSYMLGATAGTEAEGGGDLITGGTTLSYSPEFQSSSSNKNLLYRLADITGGRVLDAASNVFDHTLPSHSEPKALWPALLTAILFLFLFDIFLRRVLIGWKEVGQGLSVAGSWAIGVIRPRRAIDQAATDRLLKIKQSVRQEDRQAGAGREEFLATLKEVKVTKSPIKQADIKPVKPIAGAAKPGEKKAADQRAESFTGQLLKAREKTQLKIKRRTEEGEPPK